MVDKTVNEDLLIDTQKKGLLFGRWLAALAAAAGLILLACVLAWVSSGFKSLQSWGTFLGALVLGAALLGAAWLALRAERLPRWLFWLVAGAAVLRLAAGVAWLTLLPVHGYHSPAEQRGYVMADAYARDQAAWELAHSDKPLERAFQGNYRKTDQYGGLLYLSAAVYRYIGDHSGNPHQPLLMVVVTASFSALAVLFAAAVARRAWGETAALLVAWGLAIYPEAVLLGSSQMREAFVITLAAAAFYGLLRYAQEHSAWGLVWVGGALALSLLFSPPYTALMLAALALTALFMRRQVLRGRIFQQRWFRFALVGLVVLVIAGVWLGWRRFAPPEVTSPLGVVSWWVKKSADWQAHLSERASGWVQKIFDSTPEWMHMPLLLFYGVVQPFLPAALIDITGAWIWQVIAIWRALGWSLLLPFMVYAPLRAFRRREGRELARALCLILWAVILIASFRSGGDLWDNPRYRAGFAALQVALAAWVWVEQRRKPDPWLPRVLAGVGFLLVWFVPWYLRRYLHLDWPVESLFKTLGLGVASALLFWIGDWVSRQTRRLDAGPQG